ncbi:MAG: HAD-IIA family hydrolase [Roseburia sp.]|nr:HAD-IIA family hydrolase [Roseburia sp.]
MKINQKKLNQKKLNQKKLFLFDIDGTLAVGDTLYEGSADLLSYIEQIGGQAYFITNNSTKSGRDYVEKFKTAFQLDTREEQFITSGYMTLRFLMKHYRDKTIFVLGTHSFIEELRKNGLHITETAGEKIDCVVAAYDSELTYGKLIQACHILFTTDVPFYATNPDLRCPIDFGFIPDCGAICHMITDTTDKIPVYLGKPNREVVDLCLELSGFSQDETLVVGDRLYTDIACGINGGVDTCVLFTGEARREDLEHTPYQPDFAFENVQELLHACTAATRSS